MLIREERIILGSMVRDYFDVVIVLFVSIDMFKSESFRFFDYLNGPFRIGCSFSNFFFGW